MENMGYLVYGNDAYEFDDRELAHIKAAMVRKLRKHESFLLSWGIPATQGSGRVSLWMHPGLPVTFSFSGGRPPRLDPAWVHLLERLSQTPHGLTVLSEKEAKAHPDYKR
ncbi:DUF7882 family protein [Leucobacter sp. GX24907]